jgi:hypothetical protein
MVLCKATTRKGTRCPNPSMAGRDVCFFHNVDPATGQQLYEPLPIDRAAEIKILEQTLRVVRRQPASYEKARTIMALIDMIERLRPDGQEPKDKKQWKPPAL